MDTLFGYGGGSHVRHPQDITRFQTLKGWFFVLITSLLLFIQVWQNYRKVERAFQLDGLTGLLSHHMFNIQLERRLAMLGSAQKLVVGYLDINRFKELNRAVGFEYADQFLLQLGRAIENASPHVIIVGRLPPDQFAMALELNSADDIDEYVRGCQLLFDRTACKMGLDASCSMGVSVYPDDGANAQAVSEVEVLIRWYLPVKGYISPAEFIPLAEENGLSTVITRIVVERAASELEQSGLLGSRIQHVAIIAMANSFQINVVAEGVETEAQLGFLKTMGGREVQGYLLGVPMAIATLREHLAEKLPDQNN